MILSLVNCNQYTHKKTNATFLFPALKVEKQKRKKEHHFMVAKLNS